MIINSLEYRLQVQAYWPSDGWVRGLKKGIYLEGQGRFFVSRLITPITRTVT